MKQLQNNFTTPEQSKRLLELGVPADSADCIRTLYKRNGDDKQIDVLIEPYSSTKRSDINRNEMEQYPCWSVGRLIEIYRICRDGALPANFIKKKQSILDFYLQAYKENIGRFNFSKLED